MKKLIKLSLLLGLIGAISQALPGIAPPAQAQQNLLRVGTVKRMVQGDLMCYVTLLDSNKRERNVGATFEICGQKKQFLRKKVSLTYQRINVNDCQSNEPCGKTRREWLVSRMRIVR